MRIELQPAYVLHTRPYRNTSLLLDAFTRDCGVVPMVARGVRKPRNERRVLLQPFVDLHISFSGRSELMTLTGVEAAGSVAGHLTGGRLYSGFYLNELLQRLLHRHDPHESLFAAYADTVHELARSDVNIEVLLRRFEHRLLAELGYGLQLQYEAGSGRAVAPAGEYYYDIENGPVPVSSRAKVGDDAPVIQGRSLLALAADELSSLESVNEIKLLMRHVLNHHLGDRPLKSRELFIRTGRRGTGS